ncbi:MAG: SCO family protein [Pseudomonadales bacterium]
MNGSAASNQRAGIRKTVAGLLVFILVLLSLLVFRITRPVEISAEQLAALGAVVFDKPRTLQHDVELIDHIGKEFKIARLQGGWALLFFGYTYCPDVCPTTLAVMRAMYHELEPSIQENTQLIFVSVDPARDTTTKIAEYMQYFGAGFTGVSGEFLQLQRLATDLNTAFYKVPGGGENYLLDHSANIVLINPKGDYHGFIKPPFDKSGLTRVYQTVRDAYASKYGV